MVGQPMTAPDRIWLQHPEDWPGESEPSWYEESEGMTWCWEPINQDDVEYIRKAALPVERIREMLEVHSGPLVKNGPEYALARDILAVLEGEE